MKKLSLLCGVFLFPFITFAQTKNTEKGDVIKLDSIVVQAFRAGQNTPVAYTRISAKQIKAIAPTVSLPMLLNSQPSVVSTTEGGNGLGYSYMRVRGSDGSRINVTINGISLNDAESQEVFWVDLPALTSFIESIQLQRGVGTSVNGSGAFGASLNIQTLATVQDSYGVADFSLGSWKNVTTTLGGGTGLTKKGLSFDVRYSNSHGEGYIRNAGGDLNSFFARLGYYRNGNSFTINYLYGSEKTGITWNGTPGYMMSVNRRYNPAGEYYDSAGNIFYYDNETDNYFQNHLQGVYQHLFSKDLNLLFAINYTNGYGYYENYKSGKKFSKYGLQPQNIDGSVFTKSDFITRAFLDNNYIASTLTLNYITKNTTIVSGASYSYYLGNHFGRVLWSKFNEKIPDNYEWYRNDGNKSDFSFFSKWEQKIGQKLYTYIDLQFRRVKYDLSGRDSDLSGLNYGSFYNFFNPKFGITYNIDNSNAAYFSIATGHKEPSRSDLTEVIKAGETDRLKSERLIDYELGYKYSERIFAAGINFYFMDYKNQLVPTGKLSENGYVIKENVSDSYRTGIEAEASWMILPKLKIAGNVALSRNKILNYISWTELYDNPEDWNYISQISNVIKSTNLSFSPGVVGFVSLEYKPFAEYELQANSKYVGKQYYDNSSNENFSIPAYKTVNLYAKRSFKFKKGSEADISLFINNLFDTKYISNAWVYTAKFEDGSPDYVEDGLFPQPGINFTLKLSLKF